ncbi:hypothetical protein Lal_00035098 [Lupinus albus]|nr:hypothetical protein Lal_00035098 [Lupinus albus]
MNETHVAVVKEMGEHTSDERRHRSKMEQRGQSMGFNINREWVKLISKGPGPSIGSELSSAPMKQVIRR